MYATSVTVHSVSRSTSKLPHLQGPDLREPADHGLLPRLLQRVPWDARRQTPSPFLSDVLYAFPAARNGGHYSGLVALRRAPRPRFQPYHGRRLPPATQRRPPPPAFGARGRRLGRRFAMYTGGLVDADDDAFADFDDY